MEYVEDEDGQHIRTGVRDLEGDEVLLHNADGYGQKDIEIMDHLLTWSELDTVKKAIADAEKRWRPAPSL